MFRQRCAHVYWRRSKCIRFSCPLDATSPSGCYSRQSAVCITTQTSWRTLTRRGIPGSIVVERSTDEDSCLKGDRRFSQTEHGRKSSTRSKPRIEAPSRSKVTDRDSKLHSLRESVRQSSGVQDRTNSTESKSSEQFQSPFFHQPTIIEAHKYKSPLDEAVDELLDWDQDAVPNDEFDLIEEDGGIDDIKEIGRDVKGQPRKREGDIHASALADGDATELSGFASRSRLKVDLSDYNIYKRETQALAQPSPAVMSTPTTFRDNAGLRQLLGSFITMITPHLQQNFDCLESRTNNSSQWKSDLALREVFTVKSIHALERRGYGPGDVMSWAWILTAQSSSLKIRRYVAFANDCRTAGKPPPPIFLLLQLLRLTKIDASSLHLLWAETEHTASAWQLSSLEDTSIVLLIRLLRHARLSDAGLYHKIVELAIRLLPSSTTKADDMQRAQRLTHFYNRFLTLLAHPVPTQPFRAVPLQQQAQLNIARFMRSCTPQLPLNREGYRALVDLQMRHAKTEPEREWARTKSPSWPPWRRDQLGIDEKKEYTGRFSRAMKILQRMQEAGYSFAKSDNVTQILAGWDTDKSPTIQTRRLSPKRIMPWLKSHSVNELETESTTDPEIWTARVHATRTIREAWSCFYHYMEVTEDGKRNIGVYQAMLEKLLSNTVSPSSSNSIVAGDGREVWPEPVSLRDQVYVSVEPPSVDELYAQMISDGLKPHSRLLADLLNKAPSVERGLQYISDSTLDEQRRDVLCHAEKYPPSIIRNTIFNIPQYVFAALLKLLARRSSREARIFRSPGSQSYPRHSANNDPIRCLDYAEELLELSGVTDAQPYDFFLDGIRRQVNYSLKQMATRDDDDAPNARRAVARLWPCVLRTLELMRRHEVVPSMNTFRNVAAIAQHLRLLAPSLARIPTFALSTSPTLCQMLFVQVISGSAVYSCLDTTKPIQYQLPVAGTMRGVSLPQCLDLELAFICLAETASATTALTLLEWMNEGAAVLRLDRCKPYHRMYMMAAVRIALERSGHFHDNVPNGENNDQPIKGRQLCESFGWPTDDEMDHYFEVRQSQYALVR